MKRVVIVFLLLLVLGCAEKIIEEPQDLLPKEKMVDVLYDIALLQAIKSTNKSVANTFDSQVMQLIYRIHDIDSAQLARSDLYYASIPLEYQNIYEEVESRLDKRKKELAEERQSKTDSARKRTRQRTDSIKENRVIKEVQENLPKSIEK